MPQTNMNSQLTPMLNALQREQQRLFQIADRLCNEYWDSYYQYRDQDGKQPVARYTVTAYKRTTGIEIRWRRRRFVKAKDGWHARDESVALSEKHRTLKQADLNRMLPWERELATRLEEKFSSLRMRSQQLVQMSRTLKNYENMIERFGLTDPLEEDSE